jgi:succinyl-diaminopimelate desuccinylase
VRIEGGVAGNVVPTCAPSRSTSASHRTGSEADAEAHVREVLDGWDVVVTDSAPGALPGLSAPQRSTSSTRGGGPGGQVRLDRRRALRRPRCPRAELRPGDPNLAHTREESVEVARITEAEALLRRYLS